MVAWTPSLRHAGHRAAEVDPTIIEAEVFEMLDSDASGFVTLAKMEPLMVMATSSKSKSNLRKRLATAMGSKRGLSLTQFVAFFREDKNRCVDNYYEKVAVEEMSPRPQTPKASPSHKSKVLQASDLEAEMQASALASWSSPVVMTSPSRGFLSTSPQHTSQALPSPTAVGLQDSQLLFLPKDLTVGFPAMPSSWSTTFSPCELPAAFIEAPTVEELETGLQKTVEVAASPSKSKASEITPTGSSHGSKAGPCESRRSTVNASADTGAKLSCATPVKSKMTKAQSSAKNDKDGQKMHRNRHEVGTEIANVLKECECLQQGDFDVKVRQHLHAILGQSGRVKLHEALQAVMDTFAKKKRKDVRNFPAYMVRILQSFHSGAPAADFEEEVAEGQGAKAAELQDAMTEIQRLKEELVAAKEEQARDAASPAKRRASIGVMMAPETDSEDDVDEMDDQDELDTFPAPPDSQSWEWPLSRHEKKVRVQLLERQIHAADKSALVRQVKQVRRASLASRVSLASTRNSCPSDDED